MTVLTTRDHSVAYLTVAEVAAELHCSEPTVRRRIRDGELPAVQLRGPGAAVRVPRAGLDAWLYPTGQLRTVHAGHKLHRDDPLVKRDPESFIDVTNGIPRERAVVARQQLSSDDGQGNVRTVHQGPVARPGRRAGAGRSPARGW